MRGTNHTKIPHEYDITDDGFVILEKKTQMDMDNAWKLKKLKNPEREPYLPFEKGDGKTGF